MTTPGINPLAPNKTDGSVNTLTGNLVQIKLANNPTPVGVVQSMRISNSYGLDPVSGIGDIHAQEYVPTMARHQVSITRAVLSNSSLMLLGIAPQNGSDALQHVLFDILLLAITPENAAGEVIATIHNCRFDSGDIDVSAHRTVVENATFMALDVSGVWAGTATWTLRSEYGAH